MKRGSRKMKSLKKKLRSRMASRQVARSAKFAGGRKEEEPVDNAVVILNIKIINHLAWVTLLEEFYQQANLL